MNDEITQETKIDFQPGDGWRIIALGLGGGIVISTICVLVVQFYNAKVSGAGTASAGLPG